MLEVDFSLVRRANEHEQPASSNTLRKLLLMSTAQDKMRQRIPLPRMWKIWNYLRDCPTEAIV